MVSQIGSLKSNYIEWVNKPVDRSLRLFDSEFCEMLSKTPFWVVPCYWIPIILILMKRSLESNESCSIVRTVAQVSQFKSQAIVFDLICFFLKSYILVHLALGIFLWTLFEYLIHRWIFHLDAIAKNPFFRIIHFLFHGQHHKVPFDTQRLVFPVIPSTLIGLVVGFLGYLSVYRSTNHPLLVLAGTAIGMNIEMLLFC